MGLILNVYRAEGRECSLNGISARHDRLCLVNAEGPFEPGPDAPAVMLQSGKDLGPYFGQALRIVPAERVGDGPWKPAAVRGMFGGNYAATSDSRFGEAAERLCGLRFPGAVAIHDRFE